MQYSSKNGFSTGLLVLLCGGSMLWFFPSVMRDVVGYHPALINFGQIMMGLAVAGMSLRNLSLGKGKLHLVVAVVAVALMLFSGLLFLRSFNV